MKCDWHLVFCAEFTSSAPLGSHSGTSLSRRSLSSPDTNIIIADLEGDCRQAKKRVNTSQTLLAAQMQAEDTMQNYYLRYAAMPLRRDLSRISGIPCVK